MSRFVTASFVWLRRRLSVPVLRRELVEAAGRKRTYVIRAVAMIVAIAVFALMYEEAVGSRIDYGGVYSVLGSGEELFLMTFAVAITGIYLILPAIMASAVSGEKERDTIVLTIVSGMKPGDIILQKLLGRLIPMVSLLLILLPMFAVAFSLGGVTTRLILLATYTIVLTCLQVGAIGMLASTMSATTLSAFLTTYGLIAGIYFAPALPILLDDIFNLNFLWRWYDEEFVLLHIPVTGFVQLVAPFTTPSAIEMWYAGITSWLVVLVPLIAARMLLVPRAFVKSRGFTLRLFKVLDKSMNFANRLTGGVTLVKERGELPGDKPVAWREVSRRSLGQARYLFRILAVLILPVIPLILVVVLGRNQRGQQSGIPMSVLIFVMLIGAAAFLTLMAANTFVTERSSQTLNVLLTTPLTGRDIVREKLSGPFRVLKVVAIPVVILLLLECWWEWPIGTLRSSNNMYMSHYDSPMPVMQLLAGLVTLVIIMPQFIWGGAIIGMQSKGTYTALFSALAGAIAWVVTGPLLLALFVVVLEYLDINLFRYGMWDDFFATVAFLVLGITSPAPSLVFTEFAEEGSFNNVIISPYMLVGFILIVHTCFMLALRRYCLVSADRWLGRVPGKVDQDAPAAA